MSADFNDSELSQTLKGSTCLSLRHLKGVEETQVEEQL